MSRNDNARTSSDRSGNSGSGGARGGAIGRPLVDGGTQHGPAVGNGGGTGGGGSASDGNSVLSNTIEFYTDDDDSTAADTPFALLQQKMQKNGLAIASTAAGDRRDHLSRLHRDNDDNDSGDDEGNHEDDQFFDEVTPLKDRNTMKENVRGGDSGDGSSHHNNQQINPAVRESFDTASTQLHRNTSDPDVVGGAGAAVKDGKRLQAIDISAAPAGATGGGAGGTPSTINTDILSPTTPVDLDELLYDIDNVEVEDVQSLLSDDEDLAFDPELADLEEEENRRFFYNPNKCLLDRDASFIPGSPFSKPANRKSNRPTEPLQIAKWASVLSFAVTLAWVGFLFFVAIWNYNNIGRIIVECVLALLSFFGLFWNSYFIVGSIFKCFIPRKALQTNTKYCSIIPETKQAGSEWLDVTIQIPVYKESLQEVMMPTLKSCLKARNHYARNTGARCNIVLCDDGMMAFLRDNFPAAEMLWDGIQETRGRVIQLRKLLNRVPRASRRHLKGLRSRSVYEVFHRMLFYYHYNIGFVARSTVDRRGKFKKASNLNSHLRLALGAAQLAETEEGLTYEQALMGESHNEDGSRFVMFGNDIRLGHLICVNDADARMSESVIVKTVPEFVNDKTLGFTQHATKTMNEQRGESYFTNMLTVYTDTLYQGHFLLSSILGCHPPLVGHSIFLRTEAVKQCGRMRMMRKAQRWLQNIGLPFLPVDQIGFSNLRAENRIEYWSESHVSEDFELMIHLYNLGFNGRYCAYPDCEFQEGITRTFDEEAGRHRKFALGAHELVFNPFAEMFGHGVFTDLFKTFLKCDIPAYYKIFLTAYLCSYTTGGAYIIIFLTAAAARLLDQDEALYTLTMFSPAGIIVLNFVIYYIMGYATMLVSLIRMHYCNNKLLFPEYRKRWCGPCYIVFVSLRYCLVFQFLFYSVATFTWYCLGSLDHLLSRPNICGATNKDSINISRCTAFWDTAKFNSGSWFIAFAVAVAAYATVVQEENWDPTAIPDLDDILYPALFAGPAIMLAVMSILNPILLNPFILGWPFLRRPKKKKDGKDRNKNGNKNGKQCSLKKVELNTFIDKANKLSEEIERIQDKPDVELNSLATKELACTFSVADGNTVVVDAPSHAPPSPSLANGRAAAQSELAQSKRLLGGGSVGPYPGADNRSQASGGSSHLSRSALRALEAHGRPGKSSSAKQGGNPRRSPLAYASGKVLPQQHDRPAGAFGPLRPISGNRRTGVGASNGDNAIAGGFSGSSPAGHKKITMNPVVRGGGGGCVRPGDISGVAFSGSVIRSGRNAGSSKTSLPQVPYGENLADV